MRIVDSTHTACFLPWMDVSAQLAFRPDCCILLDGILFMTLAVLESGLHVLCEKPMAMNAGDAFEMAEKAGAAGVKYMVMLSNRWHPAVRYLYDLVQEGYIGRIYHCDFSFIMGYARDETYQWRVDKNRATGVLGDWVRTRLTCPTGW